MLFALHTHPGISGPKIRRNDPEHAEMPLFVGDPGSLIWVLRKKADFCAIGLISARCSSQNTPKTPPFPTCSCSETTTKCDTDAPRNPPFRAQNPNSEQKPTFRAYSPHQSRRRLAFNAWLVLVQDKIRALPLSADRKSIIATH